MAATEDSLARLLPDTLEWEQDIAADLDIFAQLSRAGLYRKAHAYFGELLAEHAHLFPVAAEYADMLLDQGSYRKAERFLWTALKRYHTDPGSSDEFWILYLQLTLACLHTKLDSVSALATVHRVLERALPARLPPLQNLPPLKLQILILCVKITMTASTFADSYETVILLEKLLDDGDFGILGRVHELLNQHPWEALELLTVYINLFGTHYGTSNERCYRALRLILNLPGWEPSDKLYSKSPDLGAITAALSNEPHPPHGLALVARLAMLSVVAANLVGEKWSAIHTSRDISNSAMPPRVEMHEFVTEIIRSGLSKGSMDLVDIDATIRDTRAHSMLLILRDDIKLITSAVPYLGRSWSSFASYRQPQGVTTAWEGEVLQLANENEDYKVKLQIWPRLVACKVHWGYYTFDASALWRHDTDDALGCLPFLKRCCKLNAQTFYDGLPRSVLDRVETEWNSLLRSTEDGTDPQPHIHPWSGRLPCRSAIEMYVLHPGHLESDPMRTLFEQHIHYLLDANDYKRRETGDKAEKRPSQLRPPLPLVGANIPMPSSKSGGTYSLPSSDALQPSLSYRSQPSNSLFPSAKQLPVSKAKSNDPLSPPGNLSDFGLQWRRLWEQR